MILPTFLKNLSETGKVLVCGSGDAKKNNSSFEAPK